MGILHVSKKKMKKRYTIQKGYILRQCWTQVELEARDRISRQREANLGGGHGAHQGPPRRPPCPPRPRQRASQDVLGLLQGRLPRQLPLASVARSLPLSVPSSGLGAFPSSSLSPLSPTADCSCSYRIWDRQPGGKVCCLVHFMETQHALCPTRLMVSIHTLRKLFMSN